MFAATLLGRLEQIFRGLYTGEYGVLSVGLPHLNSFESSSKEVLLSDAAYSPSGLCACLYKEVLIKEPLKHGLILWNDRIIKTSQMKLYDHGMGYNLLQK